MFGHMADAELWERKRQQMSVLSANTAGLERQHYAEI
jgi:hypothetical protein